MADRFKVALLGLDSSHSIEFTRLIQGDAPEGRRVDGLRVVACLRFPSPFQPEEGQDERQRQLEGWGVAVTTSFEEAVSGADGLMLELNDPAMHLEFFEKVAPLGKPVFIDKPLAGTLEDGEKILSLAKENNARAWSASSLRFIDELARAREEVADPVLCNVYGPLGKAAVGSDLVWYGVHTIEMMSAVMGRGAKSAWAERDEKGVVTIVQYEDGRRAVAECNENLYRYGGRIQSAEKVRAFAAESTESIYHNLLTRIRDFFLKSTTPVALEDALEILAIIDAAERSLESGREEPLRL